MKMFRTLPKMFTFAVLFSFFSVTLNAAEIGESPNLISMKGHMESHYVPVTTLSDNKAADETNRGLEDHQAQIFEVEGDVSVLKKGSEEWQKASKDMIIGEGDRIVTGAESHVDIAYDYFFLNIVRIQEKTKGEFRSIEPTQLFLEDGTIFSALDGLAGKTYQIATPTAVAGVRGTTFDVSYEASTGNLKTHVFPDQSVHQGEISLTSEGKEFQIVEGQGFSEGAVGNIPEEKMADAKQFMQALGTQFSDAREKGLLVLNEKSETPVEDRLAARADENKKIGGGPNDGGNTGGGGGVNRSDAGGLILPNSPKMDGDVDALVDDAMMPPSGVNFSGPEAVNDPAGKRLESSQKGELRETKTLTDSRPVQGTGEKHQAHFGKAVEFLGVGGVNPENQKGAERNVTEFFDPKGTMTFVGMPDSRSGPVAGTETVFAGAPVNDKNPGREGIEKVQLLETRASFQPPPFDPTQFFQPVVTGGGPAVQPDPNFRPEIKDQIINNNGSGGQTTDANKCPQGNCIQTTVN